MSQGTLDSHPPAPKEPRGTQQSKAILGVLNDPLREILDRLTELLIQRQELESLREKLDSLNTKVDGLEASLTSLRGDISTLKTDVVERPRTIEMMVDEKTRELQGNIERLEVEFLLIQTPAADLAQQMVDQIRIPANPAKLEDELTTLVSKRPDVLVEIAKLLDLKKAEDQAILAAMKKVAKADESLLGRIIVSSISKRP